MSILQMEKVRLSPVSHSILTPGHLNVNPVLFLFVVVFYDPLWQEKGENRKRNKEKNTDIRSPTGR